MDRERYSRLSTEKRQEKVTKSVENRLLRCLKMQGIGILKKYMEIKYRPCVAFFVLTGV